MRPVRRTTTVLPLVLAGLLGVLVMSAVVLVTGAPSTSLPVALLLIPVMTIALWAGPRVTGTVALAAAAAGGGLLLASPGQTEVLLRYTTLLIGCVLATALSAARRHREDAIADQRVELALAHGREESQRLMALMLERLPELSGADDVIEVTDRACRIARDLFGADSASYWQLDGSDAVLQSRVPVGPLAPGTRMPLELLRPDLHVIAGSRTSWARLAEMGLDDVRRTPMTRSGAAAGASTPVRVDFVTVGVLALAWARDLPEPDAAWLTRFERFADQVALAKTVVRRRLAQQESRDLTDRLQASFMPAHIEEVPHASIRLLYRPGLSQMLMGGDFIDVTTTQDGGTAFLIGDVSGHGPEQAALAAVVRAAWRGALSVPGATLKDWVVALESVVAERRPSEGLFVTAVTGSLDADMTRIDYVSAGHPPPLLLPSCTLSPLGGSPLGFAPMAPAHDVQVVPLGNDDGVLIVTDGLFEGFVAPGSRERLGYDAFIALVHDLLGHLDEPTFLDDLADRLERMNGGELTDDAAALLIVRRPLCPGADGSSASAG